MSSTATGIGLVVLDWAGTTIDHGSRAPVAAFVRTFAAHGVAVTTDEARGPMGLPKRDHLLAMLRLPSVAERWRQAHGRDWTEADVSTLYEVFIPCQLEVLDRHGDLVPGLLDCVTQLRQQGIRIGATTGYFRAAALRVQEAAARQGFAPDHSACVDDVPTGRPAPWMIHRVMEALGVYPPSAVVKVGDTVPDILEGLNAGTWSVGVTRSGNEVGLGEEALNRLAVAEQRELLGKAERKLRDAGADAVIETIAELPDLIRDLNDRLRNRKRP